MKKERLSPETIERICRLNARLTEAAQWIAERAKRTRETYLAGGGRDKHHSGDEREDYELDAVVKCSLGSDNPDFNPDDEDANLVAVSAYSVKKDEDLWTECAPEWGEALFWGRDDLKRVPFCYLFHVLCIDTLHYDFDAMLKIEDIELDVILIRQRGVSLDTALLPRKRKSSYPRSVFDRTPEREMFKARALSWRERRYARLLNQTIHEAGLWAAEQVRCSEQEYAAIGGADGRVTEDRAYEDHEMLLEVSGHLGENHPEFDACDDNIVVEWREAIYKKSQYVRGRSRHPFHTLHRGTLFSIKYSPRDEEMRRIHPCGLFWRIFEQLDCDWLKMLSIGTLWVDVNVVQRRIVNVCEPAWTCRRLDIS
jgi:hypothetical protein